ncbi:hypothetical protein HMPREF2931_06210 [Fusobacterium sp. HMSC065F01]|uniref:hypothetical protein n=1 Tax=Fusobacterium sp. HMSC065F01 TaxID=1739435 RepID=UPI0008A50C5D|nr:hypothetical protein [Fusobacterium sp. HMSC065F01]OFQ56983.1 hypothetical protein HMPREF2931_06210 [Fusobacterium sp. HMSC065F01]
MKEITPMKAIRKKCLDCSCGSSEEVKNCFAKKCPLYQFRFGYKLDENGNRRKRDLTDEQRYEMAERLKKVRDNKNLTLIQ